MAVKIRLARYGKKKRPFYRIVVAKDTAPRDGRFIAMLGTYDPCSEPPTAKIDTQKASQWLQKGAQPTPSAMQILKRGGVFQKPSPPAQ
jgi:small subunit ribosomal protein S16